MALMGSYCKAYPASRFREFKGWAEHARPAGPDPQTPDGGPVDDDGLFLYLQENYVVTAGIFQDEDVVYDNVTPEWIDFCRQDLQFSPPDEQPRD
jgi:hypothetical protein